LIRLLKPRAGVAEAEELQGAASVGSLGKRSILYSESAKVAVGTRTKKKGKRRGRNEPLASTQKMKAP
jgi:hypothetical protein